MNSTFKRNDKVVFGRPNGEQTLGTVLRGNAKSVTIVQDECRGQTRIRQAGAKWRVHPSLVRLARPDEMGTPEAPKAKRPDAEIIRELQDIECRLSPENLTCDGLLSGAQVRRKAAALRRERAALVAELGREPTSQELWAF